MNILDPNFLNQNLLQRITPQLTQPQASVPAMPPAMNRNAGRKQLFADLLMGIGAGLASGNPGASAAMFGQMAERNRGQRQNEGATNATVQWLQSRNPELAALVQQGALTPMDAIKMASQKPEQPALIQEYEYAKANGFQGTPLDWAQAKRQSVTVNNQIGGEPTDAALRKKLDEKTGEQWASYQSSGAVAGQLSRDLDMMDELGRLAPQGPIQGRLAEMFPGFSSAGDAYQSIASRVAPSLRTEGSGATSDIEYEGFLRSLPRLRNNPQGNQIISQVMRQKAQIDMERAKVVTAYNNGQIDAATARQALSDLNSRPIMTPEMRQMIDGVQASQGNAGGAAKPDPLGIRR